MYYTSTRDNNIKVKASQAIIEGIAPQGGLYVPTSFPQLSLNWEEFSRLSYQEMAVQILMPYLDDFSLEQIQSAVDQTYNRQRFNHLAVAPVRKVGNEYYLELFHGPTLTFKDLSVELFPHLLQASKDNLGLDQDILVVTITSGNTGKATLSSFANVPGTRALVFYPKAKITGLRGKELMIQEGDNTQSVAILDDFNLAQDYFRGILFHNHIAESLVEEQVLMTTANSINIGRILPQIVYYYYAYAQLIKQGEIELNEKVDFSVPTGNFGNMLAGYYAKQMGLPINKLIIATNDNNVLFDFFKSGVYNLNRPVYETSSPSIDVVLSSNFERLIYHTLGNDSRSTKQLMDELRDQGEFTVDPAYHHEFSDFLAAHISEIETKTEIRKVFERDIYLVDPHTAVASAGMRKIRETNGLKHKQIILSTASPYKFPEAVLTALNIPISERTDQQMIRLLQNIIQSDLPSSLEKLFQGISTRHTSIETQDIDALVLRNIAQL